MATANRVLLPLVGSFNFRDLGGYPAARGTATRFGLVYRSDALHGLTTADLAELTTLGLTYVIDLRTPEEAARCGPGPLGGLAIGYERLPIARPGGGARAGDLAERYLGFLEHGERSIVRILELVANAENYPLVFHSAAGKDRTGAVAALLLELLGVERGVIVEDYELTALRMSVLLERLRRAPVLGVRVDDLPAEPFEVDARTMERFLDLLHSRYGGAERWALSVGVAPRTIAAVRANLLVTPGSV